MNVRPFQAVVCAVVICGGASIGSAADLSTYHQFRIGSDIATVVRLAGAVESDVTVLYRQPALIQQLEWRPARSESSSEFATVRSVVFTFSGGQLFRMFVNYDVNKTEGLGAEDLIQSISAVYGVATRPAATIAIGSQSYYTYAANEAVSARWQDEEYSVSLIRSSQQPNFALIIASRNMDRLGQKAIIEGARLDVLAAPRIARDRLAKEAADERANQQKAKLVNKPAFKP